MKKNIKFLSLSLNVIFRCEIIMIWLYDEIIIYPLIKTLAYRLNRLASLSSETVQQWVCITDTNARCKNDDGARCIIEKGTKSLRLHDPLSPLSGHAALYAIGVYEANTRIVVHAGFTSAIKFADSVGTGNSRKKFRRIGCMFRSEWTYQAKRVSLLFCTLQNH